MRPRSLSGQRQLELIAEEVVGVRTLLDKGLERKPRLLALERNQAQIDGSVAASQAGIARARQVIAETRQQMRSLESDHAELVARELGETRKARAPSRRGNLPPLQRRSRRTSSTSSISQPSKFSPLTWKRAQKPAPSLIASESRSFPHGRTA